MKILNRAASIIVTSLVLAVPHSQAFVVFIDNFEAYTPALNQTNFLGVWTVSNGTVDVVQNFAGIPTNTIDLDGSSGDAGVFTSALQSLIAGTYDLTYQLAGSQRGDTNTVNVSMSGIVGATASHTLASSVGLTSFTLTFAIGGATNSSIVFDHLGGDNVGLLLDNVVLERRAATPPGVPDGGTTVSLLGGALALICMLRRRLTF